MIISALWKQAIRTVQFSLAALVCSLTLSLSTPAPALADVALSPTPHLALFGLGRQAEGTVEQVGGKVQAQTGSKIDGNLKQVSGRAKSDIGRVENAAERTADKAGDKARDLKKSSEKNLNKAEDSIKDAANNAVDSLKSIINK